jgi:hypothetical protein
VDAHLPLHHSSNSLIHRDYPLRSAFLHVSSLAPFSNPGSRRLPSAVTATDSYFSLCLVKNEGATKVYALLTHGVLSGDAIPRLNASAIDKVVVTNSVPQDEHVRLCPKLEVLDVSPVFAEAIRRVHHGESISSLFQF